MASKIILALTLIVVCAEAQRPFYAGLQPIGYPAIESNDISNRFGNDPDLPMLGPRDVGLTNRFNSMPVDKQPFWFINRKAYTALRNQPQTWELRPNRFLNAK